MLLNLTQTGIRGLFRLIDKNVDIVRILSSIGPVNRLKSLMDLIKEKTMLPEQQKIMAFNTLRTPSEESEHKGFSNFIKGVLVCIVIQKLILQE